MEYFLPTRARPVHDIEGRMWRSAARFVVSIFVKQKDVWHSTSIIDIAGLCTPVAHPRLDVVRDDTHIDGTFAVGLLRHPTLLQQLNIETVRKICPSVVAKAYVAVVLLQLTQHPSMQRLLLKERLRAKAAHLRDGTLSFSSIIYVVAELARRFNRRRARRLAVVAVCAIEHHIDAEDGPSSPLDCELFQIIDTFWTTQRPLTARARPGSST